MIEITVPRKRSILVESPVIFGAGSVGYDGAAYRKLLAIDKFGALITTPVTLHVRQPANGPRVVSLPSGFLLHTGLPNRGIQRTIEQYEARWKRSVLPVILHLVADTPNDMEIMARIADRCPEVDGLEIGLPDQVIEREVQDLIRAARHNTDLPILARLPLYESLVMSEIAQRNGADALVVAAPPRGTERDHEAERLVGGRLYGGWLKAQALRMVGRVAQYADVPIIGAGGIHSLTDAQDFLTAGAVAVQLDSLVWLSPSTAEKIARELSSELTRTASAVVPEWDHDQQLPPPPEHLPELPQTEEFTQPRDQDEDSQYFNSLDN